MAISPIRNFRSIKLERPQDREILEKVSHSIGMAQALSEPLWLGDEKHRTIYVNPVWENLTGYKLEEYIGKPADYCFTEKSKKMIADQHKLRKKGLSSKYEATMINKSGEKIPVLISGSPTSAGGTIGLWIDLRKNKKLVQEEHKTDNAVFSGSICDPGQKPKNQAME
ncbi:MAG: PAS domain-containing protein [bacterium]|nr:PAS domain-containing protein [bacterium]